MSKGVVFLGGTCNDDPWRDVVEANLKHLGVPYFNPVVKDWNELAQKREDEIKAKQSTIQMFVITSKMTGVFSIAEVVHAAHTNPRKTILGICKDDFTEAQLKSLLAVANLVLKITEYNIIVDERGEVLKTVSHLAKEAWDKQQPVIVNGVEKDLVYFDDKAQIKIGPQAARNILKAVNFVHIMGLGIIEQIAQGDENAPVGVWNVSVEPTDKKEQKHKPDEPQEG